MRLTRGQTVVAALLALQCAGLGAAFATHGGWSASAAPAPIASSPTPVVSASVSPAPTPTPTVSVAPFTALIAPDALVDTTATLTAAQVQGLRAATGATSSLLVDAGHIRLGKGTTTALGVDPSTFRAWTPTGTAQSDALWVSVARGRLAVAHAVAAALATPLGTTTTAGSTRQVVGALATTALPGIGLVVDADESPALGLTPRSALLLTASGRDPVVTAALAQRFLTAQHLTGTATSTRIPETAGHLQWVAPAYGPITSPFGARDNPNDPGHIEIHEGIDIGATLGSPIYAAADGVVQYAGPAEGFGQEVILTHAGGVTTIYGHMETILVTSGPVTAGEPIALVGAEGDATGPHLHFGVEVGSTYVDPAAWLIAHGVHIQR